jgi:hypothetical protein
MITTHTSTKDRASSPASQQRSSRAARLSRALLAYILCLATLPPSTRAEEPAEKLEPLRKEYQAARDTSARKKGWDYEAFKALNSSGQALLPELLAHWFTMPTNSAEAAATEKEIRAVFKTLAGSRLTENWINQQSFFARRAWPLLVEQPLTPEQVNLMLDLTKPNMGVRLEDQAARDGKWTEGYGSDVQATHALALIRAGKAEQAREEIDNLQRKFSIKYKTKPKGRLDHHPETGDARYRDYLDYLQVCEALFGLQAAIAGDAKSTAQHIENARKLREDLSPEARQLVAEIERLVVA